VRGHLGPSRSQFGSSLLRAVPLEDFIDTRRQNLACDQRLRSGFNPCLLGFKPLIELLVKSTNAAATNGAPVKVLRGLLHSIGLADYR
jgi:hypothetical protein